MAVVADEMFVLKSGDWKTLTRELIRMTVEMETKKEILDIILKRAESDWFKGCELLEEVSGDFDFFVHVWKLYEERGYEYPKELSEKSLCILEKLVQTRQ